MVSDNVVKTHRVHQAAYSDVTDKMQLTNLEIMCD